MPELPEVETIVRGLERLLTGLKVLRVEYVSPHLLTREPQLRTLEGDTFKSFSRRGKYMIAHLKSGRRLMIHLRMSGRILIAENIRRQDRHDHLELSFSGTPTRLIFRDVRKFGILQFVQDEQQRTLDSLGIEATAVTPARLQLLFKGKKRPIKPLLLDQTVIAGLGNIYVDESLFRSRIHPLRSAGGLSRAEIKLLAQTIKHVMALAIRKMGTTFDSYSGVNGDSGRFARYLKVYQLQGSRCGRCGSIIRKIRAGGRGTHFCPRCQRAPRSAKPRGR